MNAPPTLKFRQPTVGGARTFPSGRGAIPRPSAWVLLPVYLAWIGIIVAFNAMPTYYPVGVLQGVMVLVIWIPIWAYFNWSVLVDDLPSTYSSIIVALVIVGSLQVSVWWDSSELKNCLRLSLINTRYYWVFRSINIIPHSIFYISVCCCRFLNNRIYDHISQVASSKAEQCADGKPPEADQTPHEINPNTRLP